MLPVARHSQGENPSTVPRATPNPNSTQGPQRGLGQKLLLPLSGAAMGLFSDAASDEWQPVRTKPEARTSHPR